MEARWRLAGRVPAVTLIQHPKGYRLMEQKTSIAPTTALVDCARIFAAIELSKKTWLLAVYRPSLDRTSQYRVKPGDAAHLL